MIWDSQHECMSREDMKKLQSERLVKLVKYVYDNVEFYRNIPLLIQLFAIYLVITEFLPDIFTPVEFGSWALLSKAGFQFAVPELLGWANLFAIVVGVLAACVVRVRLLKKITSLMSNVFGGLGGIGAAVFVWCAFGVIGGWSKPVLEGFMVEGGASATPEFLTLWLGLTLFTSASIAEIVRAGVLAVPQGQWRAAEALGMTRMQAISYVVLPQS